MRSSAYKTGGTQRTTLEHARDHWQGTCPGFKECYTLGPISLEVVRLLGEMTWNSNLRDCMVDLIQGLPKIHLENFTGCSVVKAFADDMRHGNCTLTTTPGLESTLVIGDGGLRLLMLEKFVVYNAFRYSADYRHGGYVPVRLY